MGRSPRRFVKNRGFWLAGALGLGLDRLSKAWVTSTFALSQPPESWPLWPGVFHFTYVVNDGAAFSAFRGGVGWLKWLSLVVSLVLMAMALRGPRWGRWLQWGYGLILAGALGNGIDRFWAGHVVDFLDVRLIQFPIFNLADTFINLGIACLAIALWREPDPRAPQAPLAADESVQSPRNG
jgi:signal peptidase II